MGNASAFCNDGMGMFTIGGCAEFVFFTVKSVVITYCTAQALTIIGRAAIGNIPSENVHRFICAMGMRSFDSRGSSMVMRRYFTRRQGKKLRVNCRHIIMIFQGQPASLDCILTHFLFPIVTAEMLMYTIQDPIHQTPLQHRGAGTIRILSQVQPLTQARIYRITICSLMKLSTDGRGPLRRFCASDK